MTKVLFYLEKSAVRGGIEVFAERHVARLRAEGRVAVDRARAGRRHARMRLLLGDDGLGAIVPFSPFCTIGCVLLIVVYTTC